MFSKNHIQSPGSKGKLSNLNVTKKRSKELAKLKSTMTQLKISNNQ
jgi:hypothetical protein